MLLETAKNQQKQTRSPLLQAELNLSLFSEHPILTAGLISLLPDRFATSNRYSDMQCLNAAIAEIAPDILVLDVETVITLATIEDLSSRLPLTRFVLWVNKPSREFVSHALAIGVSGILCKNSSVDSHLECLNTVIRGKVWVDENIAVSLEGGKQVRLSPRERQIVGLLVQGLPNKEIAWQLGLTPGTVKFYLSQLFDKVGVSDRFELALMALRNLTPHASSTLPKQGNSATTNWLPATLVNMPPVFTV